MTKNSENRRSQDDRSNATRQKLIEAATASLVAKGYARTTAVEICAQAGVTRGALFHHFENLAALLVAALEDTYKRLFMPFGDHEQDTPLDEWLAIVWQKMSQPEFKAVIEIWLAARNNPDLAPTLQPVIDQYVEIFAPDKSNRLRRLLGEKQSVLAFYRMAIEVLIGLALGRATTPNGKALAHEKMVLDQLMNLAKQQT